MDYSHLTPAEAERELERFEIALDNLRKSEADPERRREIETEIKLLRNRLDSPTNR